MVTQARFKLFMTACTMFLALCLAAGASAAQLPDFTDLVKDAAPAVVNISTTKGAQGPGQANMPFSEEQLEEMPEFFQRFFGGPGGPGGSMGPGQRPPQQSMGSGFIVSADGYIVTNNHVVADAEEIIIRLSDRRELEATIVGTDPRSDLAILKVDATDLPVVKLAEPDELQVGEWVLAIGSPFGFDQTATAGIVSAKGRSLPTENYVPFIQTDVAINPGNSGGPLLNMDGEVVGVNAQIYTRSGGFMGVSFAIPVDVVMNVFDQIRDKGHVTRGWLGVMIQEVNRDLAQSFGLSKPYGALVAEVMPGSPAGKAGLQPGDVILEFNGEEVSMSSDLPPMVGRVPAGSMAELTIMRGGEKQTVEVEIETLPDDQTAQRDQAEPAEPTSDNVLGIDVQALTDAQKQEADLDGGVLITEVYQGPALKAGIRPGDVIRSLNNQEVKSVEEFRSIVEDLPRGKAIPVLIIRSGQPSFIVLRIPKEE